MKVTLYNGDCLEVMDKLISGGVKVDAIITDPPYGMSFQSNRRVVKKQFDKIANDNNLKWLDEFIDKAYLILNNNSAIYVFCSWHNIDVFKQKLEAKFKLKNIIVWVKNNHGSGDLRASYAPKHEFVLYLHKGRSLFRKKRLSDVMEFPKIASSKLLHPTEKNVDMLKVFVENNTDEAQTVLDPFMGSGSTGIACKNTNRNFIGIELDENYFNIAKGRINNTLETEPLFKDEGR